MTNSKAYFDFVNEGGEGYIPYATRYAGYDAPRATKTVTPTETKIIYKGLPYTLAQLQAKLVEANDKAVNLTDAFARNIWTKTAAEIAALIA